MKTLIKTVLTVLVVSFISLSCKNNQANKINNSSTVSSKVSNSDTQAIKDKITVLSPSEFKEKSQNNPIIDVRTPMEFSQGYIKGAKNINFFDSDFAKQINSFDKSKPIYVYCKTGHRSEIASEKMVQLGFKEVYDLKGGIINWVRNNNKIEK
ncbi:MAG: rhodanese-like domain-containing protein [Lutibacter sp.]|uniref:rhodanese-like domain-containing protein n=1 Tax=Lutibacter sp. TaxID=1925666 RepID=UPI00299D0DB1|nr:rhodanese-like domain-containing protein [Lutibacter sp.]MDX1829426.1 rhodanese-like domain-containing protein [Lutibacter sp.]